jgi:hypothetical protein
MVWDAAPWWGGLVFLVFGAAVSIIALWKSGQLRDLFNNFPTIDKVAENVANTLDKAQADTLAQYQRSLKDAQALIEELKKKLNM